MLAVELLASEERLFSVELVYYHRQVQFVVCDLVLLQGLSIFLGVYDKVSTCENILNGGCMCP